MDGRPGRVGSVASLALVRIEVEPSALATAARGAREAGRAAQGLVPTVRSVGDDVLSWAPDLTLQDAVLDLVEVLRWALGDVAARAGELGDDLLAAAAHYDAVDFLDLAFDRSVTAS